MEIQISTDNYKILSKSINDLLDLLKELSLDYKEKSIDEKNKLALFDITLRVFPNIKAIDTLLHEFFQNNYKGINLSIGLIMRCCLEDILFGYYLLTFKEHISMLDTEVDVKSLQFFKSYIHFLLDNESEYFLCDKYKVEEIRLANIEEIEKLKKKFPFFYEENELAQIKIIRRNNQFHSLYFNRNTMNSANVKDMFLKVKENDFNFSYIYFVYKYYCLYEHYTYHARYVIELNPYSFGQLALGFEFICRGLQKIIPFITEVDKYNLKLVEIKSNLSKMITDR
jgi:hypothetical protein